MVFIFGDLVGSSLCNLIYFGVSKRNGFQLLKKQVIHAKSTIAACHPVPLLLLQSHNLTGYLK